MSTAVYTYSASDGWQSEGKPNNGTWKELIDQHEGPLTFAGEIAPEAAKMIRTSGKLFQIAPAAASVRRASYLAEWGWQKLRQGEYESPGALAPVYLRDPAGA